MNNVGTLLIFSFGRFCEILVLHPGAAFAAIVIPWLCVGGILTL